MDSFEQLMALSRQQTSEASRVLQLKVEQRERDAAAAAIAQERKDIANRKAVEQRRRERLEEERKRLEVRQAKEKEMPATRNLYVLKQERIKRGLDPNGKDDPVAGPKALKSSSSSKSAATKTNRDTGPLTREEKEAKRRAAMFEDDGATTGGMALARAQMRVQGGTHASTSKGSPSNSSANNSPRPAQLVKPKAGSRPSTANSTTRPASSTAGMSARDRLKAGFDPNDMRKLNTEKRDIRTIDEIERDFKARKQAASPSTATPSFINAPRRPDRPPVPRRPSQSNGVKPAASKPSTKRRKDTPSNSDDDSSSSVDQRSYKKSKGPKVDIYELMGRNRASDMRRDLDSDDEDMEASEAEVAREEARAARLAAREDDEEQERLRKASEKKRLAKDARARV